LRGVDLDVVAGTSVSIRGSSGSGKTTLLQLLGGLELPDSGVVEVRSSDAMVSPARRLGKAQGFVFQNYQLMPELNALENVTLAAQIAGQGAVAARRAAEDLLKQVGLEHRRTHLPAKLSGGECQRVALARALVNQPSLLLADEPTGNLDERTAEEVMALLLNLVAARGLALVLVTHSTEFASRTQERYVLSGGVLMPA
jgi:ABC-type lipoprotein export system ATPase subunit